MKFVHTWEFLGWLSRESGTHKFSIHNPLQKCVHVQKSSLPFVGNHPKNSYNQVVPYVHAQVDTYSSAPRITLPVRPSAVVYSVFLFFCYHGIKVLQGRSVGMETLVGCISMFQICCPRIRVHLLANSYMLEVLIAYNCISAQGCNDLEESVQRKNRPGQYAGNPPFGLLYTHEFIWYICKPHPFN